MIFYMLNYYMKYLNNSNNYFWKKKKLTKRPTIYNENKQYNNIQFLRIKHSITIIKNIIFNLLFIFLFHIFNIKNNNFKL